MRATAITIFVAALAYAVAAQNTAVPMPPAAAPRPSVNAMPAALASDLDRLQSAASRANSEIAQMRIEKWKADSASKQQAQANAESLQRNLTSALPGLIDNLRAAPQDLGAGFKLYRNLNALYDVFMSFTESAGAFGPKGDYEALVPPLNVIDSVRRDLGENLESLAASNQVELNQLRTQVRNLQQAAAAPPPPPKKVVVDDTVPARKTTHKKKPPATNSTNASGSSSDSAVPTKSQ
ncbi:MAG TPA: hypothetical protein VMD98_10400 [Bryocella sp.]|nr:hypothetical protein [Bryocella sp.]